MTNYYVLNGEEAKLKLLKGVETLTNAVKITLGPKGRNAILNVNYISPLITNDGVSIAREINLNDPIENLGVKIIREACTKTNDVAGDGTTTATILAERIFCEGIKSFSLGCNPIMLRNGIKKAVDFVVKYIKDMAIPVKDNLAINQIAKISAGSEEVGKLIAYAFEQVGLDGVITIEEGNSSVDTLNIVEGARIQRGYISPYMCTDQVKLIAEMDNPYVLITDKKISHINEILPVIEKVNKVNGNLFIIAEDLEGDALTTIVVNNMRKTFNCLAVKTPFYGDRRKKTLDDLALALGGKFVSNDLYNNFNDLTLEDLGRCEKVKSDKDDTIIIGAKGNKELIAARVKELKEKLTHTRNEYERDVIKGRISQLNGGVAVIKVGAISELECKERKLRIEDALNATMSAIEEGIIAGGGVALLRAQADLNKYIETLSGDEKYGAVIVSKAIEAPIRQIAINAGVDDGVVVQNVIKNKNKNYGYDALTNSYCDMLASGIIDPLKVTRTALECAGSVASTLLTTECVVAKDEVKTEIN